MRTLTLALAFLVLVSPAVAADLDEILSQHREARGGVEAWKKVESLQISGIYTAFSAPQPCTITKARGHKMRADLVWGEREVVLGFDGETAWWINNWFEIPWATRPPGPEATAIIQDASLTNPLFEGEGHGWTIEYVGLSDFDGMPGHELKVTRSNGDQERWYLDPETMLESVRVSMGADFGFPVERVTFFSDFREVEGLMIPFHTEMEFSTRLHRLQIETVRINPDVDMGLFELGPPAGMKPLQPLVNSWSLTIESKSSPRAEWAAREAEATVESRHRGGLIEIRLVDENGTIPKSMTILLSHDRFRDRYRAALYDDFTNLMTILEGVFEGQKLILDNVETKTGWTGMGQDHLTRVGFTDIGPAGFRIEMETSSDGGENWFLGERWIFKTSGD